MCGIAGQWNKNLNVDTESFMRMRDTLTHRGPDGAGLYMSADKMLALGHRRLSLIDLDETGSQPMHNEDNSIQVVVNGEIYNYPALKKELESHGHIFYSTSDSEIIVHAYEEWGTRLLSHIKGMFAFAVWDEKKQKIFLARDRFGIKPLYYYSTGDTFIFASELKAILAYPGFKREIDYTSFCDFFVYRYIPSPKTIWKNVCKLPPASFLTLDLKKFNKPVVKQYWDLSLGNQKTGQKEIIEKIDKLLCKSVEGHLLSDVPIGSFLSGGYDSSAMVYYMHRLKYPTQTFSIGFENWEQSEHLYAEMVADIFQTQHESFLVGKQDFGLVNDLVYYYDEPIADISIIPTYIISKAASKKVKAVLSGEGADEIFGGYHWQKSFTAAWAGMSGLRKLINKPGITDKDFTLGRYNEAMAMGLFDHALLKEFINPKLHDNIPEKPAWFYESHLKPCFSPLKTFQYLDIKTFMGELVLTKIDRASMANSLEVRVPFLDHEIVELLFSLDEKVYFKPDTQKFVLNSILKPHLPEEIMNRPKQGFVGPDSYYMDIDYYQSVVLDGRLVKDELINRDAIEKMVREKDHWRLWKVMVMELWYQKWMT